MAGAAAAYVLLLKGDDADASDVSATVTVEDVRGVGSALVVRDGTADAIGLAGVPAAAGNVSMIGNVVELAMPVVVESGGKLHVGGIELRLRSDADRTALVEVRGGELEITNATVTSWDPAANAADTNIKDGRASVLVTAAGNANVESSRLIALGYEETDRHGFSLTGGSTSGSITDTFIDGGHTGLTISGNVNVTVDNIEVRNTGFAGIELAGTTGVDVTSSVVQESAGDGIVVRGGSANITIEDNDVFANDGTGISLAGSTGRIDATGNLSHRNLRSGITVSNTRDAHVGENRVWGNQSGISLVGGNSGTVISGNQVSGNNGPGVESLSAGNTALVHDNTIDHNEHGVVIADGTIEVRSNRIEGNTFGVALLDKSPRAVIRDNTIVDSADGGIRLVNVVDVDVHGNTIMRNRMAPFIVDHANDSLPFQDKNTYDAGRKGTEWVYEPLRSIGELADLTPVPAEFFSQPNVEYLIPVEQGGIRE